MISLAKIGRVRAMLAEEKRRSFGVIAKACGVSRTAVARIATGKPMLVELLMVHDGPAPQRCAGCGGMVYMPCKLCRVRAWMARRGERCAA